MEFMKIEISDLKHAEYNPRKDLKSGDAEFEKIRNSITEFGYVSMPGKIEQSNRLKLNTLTGIIEHHI